MRDIFRPRHDPAQSIYDAFQAEAEKRNDRGIDEWAAAERNAVFHAAISAAQRMGLRSPTMDEVERAERSARGHIDYGSKWAHYITDAMRKHA